MATDIFLDLGDIKGESLDARHRGEIELVSWAWGLSNPGPVGSFGPNSGRATFHDFNFVHRLDKASPRLMQACATGQHIPRAVVTERRAGAPPQEFLVITLTDVIVTAVRSSASTGGDGPMEEVNLQAATVDLTYKPQRQDGSLDVAVEFAFDIAANKVL